MTTQGLLDDVCVKQPFPRNVPHELKRCGSGSDAPTVPRPPTNLASASATAADYQLVTGPTAFDEALSTLFIHVLTAG